MSKRHNIIIMVQAVCHHPSHNKQQHRYEHSSILSVEQRTDNFQVPWLFVQTTCTLVCMVHGECFAAISCTYLSCRCYCEAAFTS
jgi:hypothetical protein